MAIRATSLKEAIRIVCNDTVDTHFDKSLHVLNFINRIRNHKNTCCVRILNS